MKNRARETAAAWEADAIEKCRANPNLVAEEASGDLCITCMMAHPCQCDWRRTLPRMREFYEANRRTAFRREPVLDLSWGERGDGLMHGLYQIATKPFEDEIRRLKSKLTNMTGRRQW